jgi:hypothetical protein
LKNERSGHHGVGRSVSKEQSNSRRVVQIRNQGLGESRVRPQRHDGGREQERDEIREASAGARRIVFRKSAYFQRFCRLNNKACHWIHECRTRALAPASTKRRVTKLLPHNANQDRRSTPLHNDAQAARPLVDVTTTSVVNTAATTTHGVDVAAAAR